MKKIIHICLSLLLLISTAGLSVSKHICMGSVRDVSILYAASQCEEHPGMETTGCCENETEHYQVEDDFQSQNLLELNYSPDQLIFLITYISVSQIQESQLYNTFSSYLSPPRSGTEIVKKVQAFLL